MQTRRLLMTLLGTGVSAFVLANHPALAATPFQPITPWTVNRIDPSNGSAPYCTLARRFTGNTVITFARNTGGEGTIAVDFQQPLFSTDETYRIGLQAGDGVKRDFMTRPATGNALVLRSGQDPEFFSALAHSTELGVIMDDKRYAFELPDLNAGMNSLSGCLGGAPAAAPVASGGVTASTSGDVQLPDDGKLASMRAELDKLRGENADIVASLKQQTAEAKPQLQSPESTQLMDKLTTLEQEKNGLVEKLQVGQQQQMQDVTDLKTALEDQKSLKGMLEQERAQRQQLESALTTQTAEAEKRGEMRARIEQLEASNKDLKALRDAVEAERSKRIAAEEALKAQATASLVEQETIRARMTDLESKNKTLQQSADELVATRSKLEDTTAMVSEEQARRQAAENALKDMSVSISKREADMQALQEKVAIERKQMDTADKAKMAALSKQHADEIARLSAQIDAIKADQAKDVADREKLMGQVSVETARREAAEQAVREMQTSLTKHEAELAAQQAKAEADAVMAREELSGKVAVEQARREAAEKTVQDMQSSISKREADMASLQEQMDIERKKMEAASAADKAELAKQHADEIARLNAQMQQTQAAQQNEIQAREDLQTKIVTEHARRKEAEQTVAELQNQITQERTKLTQAESAKEAELTKKHQDEIARLTNEMNKTRTAQTDAAAKAQADIESAQRVAQAQIEKAQKDAQAQVEAMKAQQAEAEKAAQAQIEKAQQEAQAKIDDAQKTAQAQVEQLKTQQEQTAQQADDLQTKMATESARRDAAEKAMAEYQNKVDAERKEIAKAEDAKQSDLVKKHQDEVAKLTEELALIKSAQAEEVHKAQAEVATEQARREATEKELQQAQAQLADANDKIKSGDTQISAKITDMQAQLKSMEEKNASLMSDLKVAQATTQATQSEAVKTSAKDSADEGSKIAAISAKAEADKKEMQAMLEAEKQRREKVEAVLAKGSSDDARMKILGQRMTELQEQNKDLQQKLEAEKTASAASVNPAAGGDEAREVADLKKQLNALKGDNEMLAQKLQTVSTQQSANAIDVKPVVYKDDGKIANDLAETQASLASVVAERDEYRDLLQRERLRAKDDPKKSNANESANARIKELENERADLVRKLEYEKSRAEQVASGTVPTPSTADAKDTADKTAAMQTQLDQVMAEKDKLEKQLVATQNDVIEARQLARANAAKGNVVAAKAPANDTSSADVAALLEENKRLQAELAQSANSNGDSQALQTEITALRAQNKTLNDEINKRLAAAPDRATIDNAQAKAAYTEREAKDEARKETARDLAMAQTRANEADAENVRLARELADARKAHEQQQQVAQATMAAPAPMPVPTRMQPIVSQPAPMQQGMAETPAVYTQASLGSAQDAPVSGPDGHDISGYLQRAGIPMVSGFEKINKVSTASFAAFRWDTGVVFGTAEQEHVGDQKAFKDAIAAYMEKTRNRCSGTFDQSMADGTVSNLSTADVACIMPDGTGAGAAVVFYYKDGMFNAVAHEGNLDTFDQAMTTRDKLAGLIKAQM